MFGWMKRMDRHSRLLVRMADAVDADIAAEAAAGFGHSDSLRSMMIRCTDCQQAEACEKWLVKHENGAKAAPEFCLNGSTLKRLQRETATDMKSR